MLDGNYQGKSKTYESQRDSVWRNARRFLVLVILAAMISGNLLVKVEAAAGDLDTTFSGDGKQTTSVGADNLAAAEAVAIQSDGKIMVAGYAGAVLEADFALARYNINGTLDTTFSGDGKQTTDFSDGNEKAYAIAIQSDGKIVVAGATSIPPGSSGCGFDFALARYNTDGTPDMTFSGDGKQTTDFSGGFDVANAIAIQPNGKIVVAGFKTSICDTDADFAVARYNSNGTLDTTFSGDGKQSTDFGLTDFGQAIALQANGRIVVAGYTSGGAGPSSEFALARYNSNGTLDRTFSGDGKQTTAFTGLEPGAQAHAVAVQADGKIVAAGSAVVGSNKVNFALARYKSNGMLDTTFSGDGKQDSGFFANSVDEVKGLAIQPDGKIVAAGFTAHGTNHANRDFALARYHVDGTPDTTFSGNGLQHTGFGSGTKDVANAVAIQSDGNIVAAGSTENSRSKTIKFALARYLGN